ncbi:FecR domain-containing protein [Thalassospira sp. MA62]|nr:FecR domain-containing protein [Thalassospira sp. MA62]
MTSGASAQQQSLLKGYDDGMIAISDQAIDLLVHLQSGTATPQDHLDFTRWRAQSADHERAARDAEMLLGAIGDTEMASDLDQRDVAVTQNPKFAPARRNTPSSKTGRMGVFVRRPVISAFAACAVLLLMIITGANAPEILARWNADYTTDVGQQLVVNLPDGSVAHMNTASAFSIDFSGDTRRVMLTSGEVIFDVAKDANHPFIVSALDGEAMAVGTVYGVRIDGESANVTVQEGIVEVRNGPGSALRLMAGEAGGYQIGQAPQKDTNVDLAGYGSWQRGKLIFNNRALGDVMDEVQRYQSGQIVITRDEIRALKVTGVFEIAELDSLLRSVEQATKAKVLQLPLLTVIY